MLQKIRSCNRRLTEEITEMDRHTKEILSPYEDVIARLSEIPGVQNRTCEELIAEIGLDMGNFPTAAHLCSWAGMCPGNNESAGKKKSGRTEGRATETSM